MASSTQQALRREGETAIPQVLRAAGNEYQKVMSINLLHSILKPERSSTVLWTALYWFCRGVTLASEDLAKDWWLSHQATQSQTLFRILKNKAQARVLVVVRTTWSYQSSFEDISSPVPAKRVVPLSCLFSLFCSVLRCSTKAFYFASCFRHTLLQFTSLRSINIVLLHLLETVSILRLTAPILSKWITDGSPLIRSQLPYAWRFGMDQI